MASVKPNIPKELNEIIASFDGNVKLKKFFSNPIDEPSFSKYVEKYTQKKEAAKFADDILENSKEQLIEADESFFASKKYAALIILQGMDTAGKDGIISHVLGGVNPQGCRVESFKAPTADEHAHNFLWRYSCVLPKRGEIVIFNRSHYEDVLVTKVHPECMEMLPPELSVENNKSFWEDRYKDINAFEKHLARNGVLIIKFFLYISKDEQKARLLERLSNVEKYWKASSADLKERNYWDKYIQVYEEMLSNTSNENAPWLVVPADNKKVARAIVAHTIAEAIKSLKVDFPKVNAEDLAFLRQAKDQLEAEK